VPRMLYEFQKVEGPGGLVLAEHGQRHVALVLLAESALLTAIEDILASVTVPIGRSGVVARRPDQLVTDGPSSGQRFQLIRSRGVFMRSTGVPLVWSLSS
jgi:hypothetical protein